MVAVAGQIDDLDLRVGNALADQVSIWSAAIGISLRLDELAARLDGLVLERLADHRIVDVDAGGGEVAEQLADHVLVAGAPRNRRGSHRVA